MIYCIVSIDMQMVSTGQYSAFCTDIYFRFMTLYGVSYPIASRIFVCDVKGVYRVKKIVPAVDQNNWTILGISFIQICHFETNLRRNINHYANYNFLSNIFHFHFQHQVI